MRHTSLADDRILHGEAKHLHSKSTMLQHEAVHVSQQMREVFMTQIHLKMQTLKPQQDK